MSFLYQTDWNVYQGRAWAGQPGNQDAHLVIRGVVSTGSDTNDRKPRPGYPVFYNDANGRWQVPRTDSQIRRIQGVVLYRPSDIMNDSGNIVYENDTAVEIMIRGTVWVMSGDTILPMEKMTWDNEDADWVSGAAPEVSVAGDIAAHTAVSGAVDDTALNTALTEMETNINTVADDIVAQVNNSILDFGYTRIASLAPRSIASGEMVEAYINGSGII